MKIFVGTAEIAGMMTFIVNALKDCGHEVTSCTDNYGANFYDYNYDIILNKKVFKQISSNRIISKFQTLINVAVEKKIRNRVYHAQRDLHDVYIFIWNGFLPSQVDDYAYLKKHGKKIITLFLGSDVRHVSAFTQEYNLDVSTWEMWFHSTDINNQLFRLRKAELFSDTIFSVPDQAGLAIRPYYKVFIPFDVHPLTFHVPERVVPKIVHIPSRSGIKGTSFILEALEELRNEGVEFEFEFISGVSNAVVLDKLKEADILIDEVFLHGPGTLSLEGIACGCAVATKSFEGELYDDVVCNINLANMKEKVKKLITDLEYRKGLAYEGRNKIKIINDPKRIAVDLLEKTFQSFNIETVLDYYPRFFSDFYKLPENTEISVTNKNMTRQIIEKYQLSDTLDLERMNAVGLI